jgi:hypothetical protein
MTIHGVKVYKNLYNKLEAYNLIKLMKMDISHVTETGEFFYFKQWENDDVINSINYVWINKGLCMICFDKKSVAGVPK